jgi:transaldolase/glucose-6-phosphate isomerase
VRIALADVRDLGQEFFRWEIATAVAGSVLSINPFDQPDVEAAKVASRTLLESIAATGSLPPETPSFTDAGLSFFADLALSETLRGATRRDTASILRAHLARLQPGDYFAVQAYVERSVGNDHPLQVIRHAVRDAHRVATTIGYGPRFLHSTGQLHKGGTNSGVFLQITSDDAVDLAIPGERATFGMLKTAQARGDFQVLVERSRRILRVHLGPDVHRGLETLASIIEETL